MMCFKFSLMMLNILLLLTGPENTTNADDCVWDKDTEFPTYPPLIMNKNTWMSIIPVLNGDIREMRIGAGERVVMACPETTFIDTGTEVLEAVCEGGNILKLGKCEYTMNELGCARPVKESLQKNLGLCGNNSGNEHTIGFSIQGYPFYELVRICFDPLYETALFTKHLLRGEGVTGSDSNPSRPGFRKDTGFFTVSPNKCYKIDNQDEMITNLLGDEDIIDRSNNRYFARGHLAPDSDFNTEMEADATYYYINAAPQWQSINGGNWRALENDIRNYADISKKDLLIWTGIWNILKMNDQNNNEVDIHLGYYQGKAVIPAPNYMWKNPKFLVERNGKEEEVVIANRTGWYSQMMLGRSQASLEMPFLLPYHYLAVFFCGSLTQKVIYEQSTDRGVAVVTLNNPYATSFPTPICQDICDQVEWLDFDFQNLVSGATYCCTVQELRNVIPHAPDLGQAGLLDN